MKSSEKSKENEGACSCPYCEEEISLDSPHVLPTVPR